MWETLKYAALSYTWGKASNHDNRQSNKVYEVILSGQTVKVHENLHDALRYLSPDLHAKSQPLWIDFICINQADLSERARQVRLMKRLYEQADEIIGWLGVPSDDRNVRLGVALMHRFRQYMKEVHSWFDEPDGPQAVVRKIHQDRLGFPEAGVFDESTELHAAWEGIRELLNLPYWGRTWVWQEATAPGKAIRFVSGGHAFNDSHLSSTIYFIGEYEKLANFPRSLADLRSTGSRRVNYGRIRREEYDSEHFDLLSLLVSLRRTSCTDPRDKVYAAVGHAIDLNDKDLEVDYSKSVSEVYTDVVQFSFERESSLRILDHVNTPAPESPVPLLRERMHPRLPSWVPDWRQRIEISTHTNRIWKLFDACAGLRFHFEIREIRQPVLVLHGFLFDSTTAVSTIWDTSTSDHTIPRLWLQELKDQDSRVQQMPRQAFDRALRADTCGLGDGSPGTRGATVDWDLLDVTEGLSLEKMQIKEYMVRDMHIFCFGRRAAFTRAGRVAIVPAATQPNDVIAILGGGRTPYVLRSDSAETSSTNRRYTFVGSCYVDGFMDGEALQLSDIHFEDIHLV